MFKSTIGMLVRVLVRLFFADPMPLGVILKRLRREWRLLALLLAAVCLITGFFALGPLFLRSVTEVDLRYSLANADPDDLKLTIVGQSPLTQESQTVVEEELGALVVDVERYQRATPPDAAGNGVCGFNFLLGISPFRFGGGNTTPNCYQPFAFEDLDRRTRLVDGRWPQRGPTPEDLAQATQEQAPSDELQQELGLGLYSRWEVEAVVTDVVAEEAELEVGSRFFLGHINLQGQGAVTRVKIVGIVEVLNPNDAFWDGNRMFVQGAEINLDLFNTRYDYGLAFHPAAYEDWVVPAMPLDASTSYIWRMDVDTDVIDSVNAEDYQLSIAGLADRLGTNTSPVQVFTELSSILGGYEQRIEDAEGPIIWLSGGILIMMLYHLITTVTLVLQQQGIEWGTISSRGGSSIQLLKLQAITVIILGVIAFAAGPVLSRGFMYWLENFGPLAKALEGVEIGGVATPVLSYLLSLGAAAACVFVLSFPAITAARKSLLLLKQSASRPPTSPAWSRYYLDVFFLLLGVVFLLRLYWNVSEDESFSSLLADVVQSPNEVIQLVADRAADTRGLSDPFNLLAPALILTGLALLWLRVFPAVVRLVSRYTSRSNKLATPLAVWNVERDPGHYAQLVLLLIGTLALGTASLGLSETREVSGWEAAQQAVGGPGRVEFEPRIERYDTINWGALDGVEDFVPVAAYRGPTFQDKSGTINLIGVTPDEFADTFPAYAELVEKLDDTPFAPAGIALAEDAATLQVQVWSTSIGSDELPEASVALNAYVIDADGVIFRVQMVQSGVVGDSASVAGQGQQDAGVRPVTPPERWLSFTGDLPPNARGPLRLFRVGLATTQGDIEQFAHTVYLDYWQTVDVNGTATLVGEQENPDLWQVANSTLPYPGVWQGASDRTLRGITDMRFVGERTFDDDLALRLDYVMNRVANSSVEPSLGVNQVTIERVPAVVSDDFARNFRRGARRTTLEIGEFRDMQIDTQVGRLHLGLEITDIVEEFPALSEEPSDRFFVVLPLNNLRVLLNQAARRGAIADANQVWLELEDQKPTDDLKSQLNDIEAVSRVEFAWDNFSEILREPLPSAVAGMLYAGFWVSLLLSLLDFGFYIAVTAKQRSFTFGVLRSLGWNANNIWQMLLVEQMTLITPALVVGIAIGIGLAYLLLPFLIVASGVTLQLPILSLLLMVLVLIAGFTTLLVFTAVWLKRMSVNQVLRLGEE